MIFRAMFFLLCFLSLTSLWSCTEDKSNTRKLNPDSDPKPALDLTSGTPSSLLEQSDKDYIPQLKYKSKWPNKNYTPRAQYIEKNIEAVINMCRNKNEIIYFDKRNILCLTGKITDLKAPPENEFRKYSIVYVSSNGGNGRSAIAIGLELKKNNAYLIVDGPCVSACANYIVPAGLQLYMTDRSIIAMHGSPARNSNDYVDIVFRGKGIKKENTPDLLQQFMEESAKYKAYEKEYVIPEVEYFSTVEVDENYVTRYVEILRTLKLRKNYICKPEKGVYLIVGPEYLDEFNIRTLRGWFPKNKYDYLKFFSEHELKDYSLIYDIDENPFYVSGRGAVTPEDCYTSP